MANPSTLTVLSLCAGYGGLELGLARALENPLRCVAVEIEAYALANLVAKAEEGKLAIEALYPDLKTFPAERFSGCFDIITAGYPCQPWTSSGKGAGTGDSRWLWPEIANIIEQVKPDYAFFENVPRIIQRGGFALCLQDLAMLGYDVSWGCCTAASVGAHQIRDRVFAFARLESVRGSQRLSVAEQQTWTHTQRTDDCDHIAESRGQGTMPRAWTEPRVGRMVYGSACRVDRLRLLGNGVIPAQAERAFRELI